MSESAIDVERGHAEVNGTRLYYEAAGEGSAVVLIHGMSLDTRMWDDQFVPFARRHRVIRYDMRGFGRSAVPDGAPFTATNDLLGLLDALEVERAHLVVLSRGGAIATHFAREHPDHVDRLVLVDAMLGGYEWPSSHQEVFQELPRLARDQGREAVLRYWLRDPLFAPALGRPDVGPRLRRIIEDYSCWIWLNDDPERWPDPPAIEWLHEIAAPTLIVIGEYDLPETHAIADILLRDIPDARTVALAGVGHMSNMEAPEEFNRVVLGFLEGAT
jgi:pimeloyl-ACP methyl ester carboxylesterase